MSYIFEFVGFFFDTFWLFAKTSPLELGLSVLAGIGLAALCWFVTVFYTRLWNTRYRPGLVHHLLCGIAALITMLFTIAYFALGYAQKAAENRVAAWPGPVSTKFGHSAPPVCPPPVRINRLDRADVAVRVD